MQMTNWKKKQSTLHKYYKGNWQCQQLLRWWPHVQLADNDYTANRHWPCKHAYKHTHTQNETKKSGRGVNNDRERERGRGSERENGEKEKETDREIEKERDRDR